MSRCATLSRNTRVGFLMRVDVLVAGGGDVLRISCISSFPCIPPSVVGGTELSSVKIGSDSMKLSLGIGGGGIFESIDNETVFSICLKFCY